MCVCVCSGGWGGHGQRRHQPDREIQMHLKGEISLETKGVGPGCGQRESAKNHTVHKSPKEHSHLGQDAKSYDLSTQLTVFFH